MTVSIAGITAQKLKHLGLLLEAPWTVQVSAETNVPIERPVELLVPNPVSFIVQKLLIQRHRDPEEQSQDALYIHDTLQLFGASLEKLHGIWEKEVRPKMADKTARRAIASGSELVEKVTDVIREADRIPQDRRLDPEYLRAAVAYGLGEVF